MRKEAKENLQLGITLASSIFAILFGVKEWLTMKNIMDLWNNLDPWKTGFFGFLIVSIGSAIYYLVDKYREFRSDYRTICSVVVKLNTDFEAKRIVKGQEPAIRKAIHEAFDEVKRTVPFKLKLGVYWDDQLNPICTKCRTPLSSSGAGNNILHCPSCKEDFNLRLGDRFYALNEAQKAIENNEI